MAPFDPCDNTMWMIESQSIFWLRQFHTDEELRIMFQDLDNEHLLRIAERHPNQVAGMVRD